MNLEYRRRPRRSSMTLVVTFLLGIGAGFTLFYSLADVFEWSFQPEVTGRAETSRVPTEPAAPPAVETPPAPIEPPKVNFEPLGAGVCCFLAVNSFPLDPATHDLLAEIKPGGVLLEPSAPLTESQSREWIKTIKEAVGQGLNPMDPPLIAIAQEGGPASNPLGIPDALSAETLGQANDPAKAKETGRLFAQTARRCEIGLLMAPVLDVFWPGISDPALKPRTFGESTEIVRDLGLAFAQGVQEGGAIPMVKHFPGMGAAVRQPNGAWTIQLATDASKQKSEIQQLAQLMFPFNEAAIQKVPALLAAHIAVPGLDSEFPNLPATTSPKLITNLLRERWKYDGFVLADDLSASPLAADQPLDQIAVATLSAGCDAILLRGIDITTLKTIKEAIQQKFPAERLIQSRMRLERLFNEFLAKAPVPPPATETPPPAQPPAPPVQEPAPLETANPEPSKGPESTAQTPTKAPVTTAEPPKTEETPPQEPAPAVDPAPVESPKNPEPPASTEATPATPAVTEAAPATPAVTEATPATPVVTEAAPATPVVTEATPAEPLKTEAAPATDPKTETPKSPDKSKEEAATDKKEETKPAKTREPVPQPPNTRLVKHVMQRGETLMGIGRTYNVSLADLIAWNALTEPNKVKFGQSITVYVPESTPEATPQTAPEAAPETTSETIPEAWTAPAEDSPAPPPSAADTTAAESTTSEYDTYTVRRGDSLEKIAKKRKVDKATLMEINDFASPNDLKAGMRIKVPKKP